jgi:hypothetical protein
VPRSQQPGVTWPEQNLEQVERFLFLDGATYALAGLDYLDWASSTHRSVRSVVAGGKVRVAPPTG